MEVVATAPDGSDIYQLRLCSDGLSADILSFGASLTGLWVEDRPGSVVLRYPDPTGYLDNPSYFGAIVGRYANRIQNGRAIIEGQRVQLDRNTDNGHLLHGGQQGASYLNWQVVARSEASATLSLVMPDGHMGFPGALSVRVTYCLIGQQLDIDITAQTDRPTLCSFAHHSYFNLGSEASIADHSLQVRADTYLPTRPDGIPTGQIGPVDGTAFDLRSPTLLGDTAFDHNFCIHPVPEGMRHVASLACDDLMMQMSTDAPGLQVYTGDGIAQAGFGPRAGIALEPQIWPDAPNQNGFPPANLRPGETYRQRTRLQFKRGVGLTGKHAQMETAHR